MNDECQFFNQFEFISSYLQKLTKSKDDNRIYYNNRKELAHVIKEIMTLNNGAMGAVHKGDKTLWKCKNSSGNNIDNSNKNASDASCDIFINCKRDEQQQQRDFLQQTTINLSCGVDSSLVETIFYQPPNREEKEEEEDKENNNNNEAARVIEKKKSSRSEHTPLLSNKEQPRDSNEPITNSACTPSYPCSEYKGTLKSDSIASQFIDFDNEKTTIFGDVNPSAENDSDDSERRRQQQQSVTINGKPVNYTALKPTSRFHANLLYGGGVPTVIIRQYSIDLDESFDCCGDSVGGDNMADVCPSEANINVCMNEAKFDYMYCGDEVCLDQSTQFDNNKTTGAVKCKTKLLDEVDSTTDTGRNADDKKLRLVQSDDSLGNRDTTEKLSDVEQVSGQINLNSSKSPVEHITNDDTAQYNAKDVGYRFKRSPVVTRRSRKKAGDTNDGHQVSANTGSKCFHQNAERELIKDSLNDAYSNTETLNGEPSCQANFPRVERSQKVRQQQYQNESSEYICEKQLKTMGSEFAELTAETPLSFGETADNITLTNPVNRDEQQQQQQRQTSTSVSKEGFVKKTFQNQSFDETGEQENENTRKPRVEQSTESRTLKEEILYENIGPGAHDFGILENVRDQVLNTNTRPMVEQLTESVKAVVNSNDDEVLYENIRGRSTLVTNPQRVTVIRKYIEPKQTIFQHHRRSNKRQVDSSSSLFIIRSRNRNNSDDRDFVVDGGGSLSFLSTAADGESSSSLLLRRRSLSADNIPALTYLEQEAERDSRGGGGGESSEQFSNADSHSFVHHRRRNSLSCNDLHLYYSVTTSDSDCESERGDSLSGEESESESEATNYAPDTSSNDESCDDETGERERVTTVEGEEILNRNAKRHTKKEEETTSAEDEKLDAFETDQQRPNNKKDCSRNTTRRRHIKKQSSFIGKSVSVDLRPQNNRYFSNIRKRRNGIVTEEGNDANDFIGDLIEFKRTHKKSKKKPLYIVKSVEGFFDKTATAAQPPSDISLRPVPARKRKPKKRFLSGLFERIEKMDIMRETCILDDDDNNIDKNTTRPQIDVVEESSQKVASVIELFIDSHGDVIRKIEITRIPGQSLGFFIRNGNGVDRTNGIFISRVTLGSFVDENNLLHYGDEILEINKVNVTGHTLEQVASVMQTTQRLVIKTRSALPLPMNKSPLLRSYTEKKKSYNGCFNDEKILASPADDHSRDGKESSASGMIIRAMSDPNQLRDRSADEQRSSSGSTIRERSQSVDLKEKGFTRGQMYRNNNNNNSSANKSPIYSRKLPVIPDEAVPNQQQQQHSPSESKDRSRSFSRASRYQLEARAASAATQSSGALDPNYLCPDSLSPTSHIKSPRLFRKSDYRKKSTDGMLSAPSSDSLSSMSDDESNSNEKLHVYPSDASGSDANTRIFPLKSYTGKLVVSIYKLIGRLSGLDVDCFCTIEINGESKATTNLRRIKEVVDFNESFEIDVQEASVLSFYIHHKRRKQTKLASQSEIHLENIFGKQYQHQVGKNTTKMKLLLGTTNNVQIRVKIEFTAAETYIQRSPSLRQNGVFGFNLAKTLTKEENTIPVIVRKCVEEIEKRGLDLVGIYRISGNARVKKQLRAQFEENSLRVDVSNEEEVTCHVLAGILKDYLRELPNPLISHEMYQNIYNGASFKNRNQTNLLRELMQKLPYTNRATLIYIMDHLKRVSANCDANKMTNQNLAVCFGPVMMSSPLATEDMLNFKKQVDALEFLLNIWPVNDELQKGL